jgi:periplasmic protein TonB
MSATGAARGDLTRWAVCALVVVGLHAAAGGALLGWHDPIGVSDESPAVVVDLAPYAPPSDSADDVAPGPLQQAALPAPQQQVEPKPDEAEEKPDEKVERKIEPEEKVEVPPAPVPPVAAVPPPEAVEPPVTPPEPQAQPAPPADTPPAPVTTAPPRPHPVSAAEVNAWHKGIYTQIQRHKTYPPAARARGEKGVVELAFSIDRQGRVLSSRVAHASGSVALDEAAIETLRKAQFPPAPATVPGDEFSFTVPVAFTIR